MNPHGQAGYDIRFDWGLDGAQALIGADAVAGPDTAIGPLVAVVVDVLSFSTAVTVALERGMRVWPYRWRDAGAAEFARQHQAMLAVGRSQQQPGRPSLSPASLRSLAEPGSSRLVLPSPNGSSISHQLAESAAVCLAGCLRNATAVAGWIQAHHPDASVLLIAAGERWPGGGMRPAIEDSWGAGAVIDALVALGRTGLSPEAQAARAGYRQVADWPANLLECASGRELAERGFAEDVAIAADQHASQVAPLLVGGCFVDGRHVVDGYAEGG